MACHSGEGGGGVLCHPAGMVRTLARKWQVHTTNINIGTQLLDAFHFKS